MKITIFLIVLSFACAANAATFNVTKTADTADGVCAADCSLREAITAANNLPGADVIIVPAGVYTITLPSTNENNNANGDFDMFGDLKITGAGESQTFVEANAAPGVAIDRVFHILGVNSNVAIEGLTVRNGRTLGTVTTARGGGIRNEGALTLRKITVSGNQTGTRGGGIASVNPNTVLSLDRVTITNNSATSTNAIGTFGGGVFTNLSTVRIRKTIVTSNRSITTAPGFTGNGGGFYALDGDVTIKDSIFSNNSNGGTSDAASSDGGGLRFVGLQTAMNVVLDGLTVNDNQSISGGASGAGISAGTAAGAVGVVTLSLSNSTVSNNSVTTGIAFPLGAGVFLNGVGLVDATITNTNITNNTATSTNPLFRSAGGGIYSIDSNLIVRNSNINSNRAEVGGGIRNDVSATEDTMRTASVLIENSTVAGNSSDDGGIANIPTDPTVDFPIAGTAALSLKNSTVSDNSARNGGGGILQEQPAGTTATTVINNSTITDNRADSDSVSGGNGGGIDNVAGTVTIKNTIVANNAIGASQLAEKADQLGVVSSPDLLGNIISADYNLFETTAGAVISGQVANNITGIDPQLANPANNGGLTQTYRLNSLSAARNAGDPANCRDNSNSAVIYDQRGLPRTQGGVRCDIGALEEGGIVWDGGGADNNFSTPANWEGDAVPDTSTYAIFNSTSGKNITIDGEPEVRGVIYGGDYAGAMTIANSLRVRDIFYLSGGTVTCLENAFVNMATESSIVRYSGYIDGTINHDFIPGSGETFNFPTGTSLGYRPVLVNYLTPALQKNRTNQNLGVASFSVRANDGALTGTNANQSINVYWTLESFGASPADVKFSYNDAEVPANAAEENFQIIRRENSTTTAFTPSAIDTFDNTAQLNNVDSFSDWTIGSLAPTAASAAISGRVLTADGGGIKNAVVVLSGGNLTTPISTRSTTFGYFNLPPVAVGQIYVVTVNAKHYVFTNSSRVVSLLDDVENFDFVSETP